MSEERTCGTCGCAVTYEDDAHDPFIDVPEPHRSWLRENCCVCALVGELPMVIPKDTEPEDIPCDFWEE